ARRRWRCASATATGRRAPGTSPGRLLLYRSPLTETRNSPLSFVLRVVSGFTDQEIERAHRYHRPRYAALVLDLVVSAVVLGALTQLSLPLLAAPPAVAAVAAGAGLPVAWWRYRHDVAWGFAT